MFASTLRADGSRLKCFPKAQSAESDCVLGSFGNASKTFSFVSCFGRFAAPLRGAHIHGAPSPPLRCAPCWATLIHSLREWETTGRRDAIFMPGCESKGRGRLFSRTLYGSIHVNALRTLHRSINDGAKAARIFV